VFLDPWIQNSITFWHHVCYNGMIFNKIMRCLLFLVTFNKQWIVASAFTWSRSRPILTCREYWMVKVSYQLLHWRRSENDNQNSDVRCTTWFCVWRVSASRNEFVSGASINMFGKNWMQYIDLQNAWSLTEGQSRRWQSAFARNGL
jgi:hypothetical protein